MKRDPDSKQLGKDVADKTMAGLKEMVYDRILAWRKIIFKKDGSISVDNGTTWMKDPEEMWECAKKLDKGLTDDALKRSKNGTKAMV